VERRQEVAESLRDILEVLNSKQPLQDILAFIIEQAIHVLGANAGVLYQIDESGEHYEEAASVNMPEKFSQIAFGSVNSRKVIQLIMDGEPVALSNFKPEMVQTCEDEQQHIPYELQKMSDYIQQYFDSFLSIPLIIRGEMYGAITIYYQESHEFSEEEKQLGLSFAGQAALAIENARLRIQAETSAVIAERSRLARDLHDSVTQSLYSLTLLSEAGQRVGKMGEMEKALTYLSRIGEISQQALREMRLLVYQLRAPELTDGLTGAIQQRLDTVERRAGIEAHLHIDPNVEIPVDFEQDLFRITQEALNNVLKHASAREVLVNILSLDGKTALEVIDDGVGFDPDQLQDQGGIGLASMYERAKNLGGLLIIKSKPGKGTRISVLY
jgi:signal transduction histidine kinase